MPENKAAVSALLKIRQVLYIFMNKQTYFVLELYIVYNSDIVYNY